MPWRGGPASGSKLRYLASVSYFVVESAPSCGRAATEYLSGREFWVYSCAPVDSLRPQGSAVRMSVGAGAACAEALRLRPIYQEQRFGNPGTRSELLQIVGMRADFRPFRVQAQAKPDRGAERRAQMYGGLSRNGLPGPAA